MASFFSRKFSLLVLGILLSLFFSYSVFAGVWNDSGNKFTAGPTLTVTPNQKLTFGAYTSTVNTDYGINGFSGNYSAVIGTSSKNFKLTRLDGTTYNHYIKSSSNFQKIRLKKIFSRSGYYNTENGKKDCKISGARTGIGKTVFCFHAQVEAVCTKPAAVGGGNVVQGESYTQDISGGVKTFTCQSDWTFSESLSCGAGYQKNQPNGATACISTINPPVAVDDNFSDPEIFLDASSPVSFDILKNDDAYGKTAKINNQNLHKINKV